jgi:hypothetical protein
VTFLTGLGPRGAQEYPRRIDGGVAMTTGFFSVFAVLAALVLVTCGIALLPALLVVGAIVLAFSLLAGIVGFVLRLVGWLLLLVLAVPLMLAGFGIAIALSVALLHVALPLLVVIGIVWLIAHNHRSSQPATR